MEVINKQKRVMDVINRSIFTLQIASSSLKDPRTTKKLIELNMSKNCDSAVNSFQLS